MAARKHTSVTQEVDAVLGPAPASFAQPEVVVLRFRRHARRLVFPVIALIAIAGAAGFWVGSFHDAWLDLAAAAAAAGLGLLLGIMPVLTWLAGTTTVSTRRVIVRRGLFVRSRAELALARVREVRTRRSPAQRMFGAGDVLLLHGAETLRLEDVPTVTRIADAMQDLMVRNYAQAERAAFGQGYAGGQGLSGAGFPPGAGTALPSAGGVAQPAGPAGFSGPAGPAEQTRVQGFMDL